MTASFPMFKTIVAEYFDQKKGETNFKDLERFAEKCRFPLEYKSMYNYSNGITTPSPDFVILLKLFFELDEDDYEALIDAIGNDLLSHQKTLFAEQLEILKKTSPCLS